MKQSGTREDRLALWKKRLAKNQSAYEPELRKMDHREMLYRGTREIKNAHTGETSYRHTVHVRNIVAELIEAQVDTNIPHPKVTARREKDEPLARLIEDMLRNELDRMPFEEMNDINERTVPIQGGAVVLVEWDNHKRTHNTFGEVVVSTVHPKQVIPQDGVYSGVEDMDYIILKLAQTKEYIKRMYGVAVLEEAEEEPDIKSADEPHESDEMVTQYIAYYRNDTGGIGLYSWVGDTEVLDLDDYQARRLRRCTKCGALENADINTILSPGGDIAQTPDGAFPLPEDGPPPKPGREREKCAFCGSGSFEESIEEYEDITEPIVLSNGKVIPGGSVQFSQDGTAEVVPVKIPYYKPDIYPLVVLKNVSLYGSFLGDSDVDSIEDQQNTINRISTSINDKLLKAGSYLTLPPNAKVPKNDEDAKFILIQRPDEVNMFRVLDMNMDTTPDILYMENVYEQSRQRIGVTDSFQGRRDTTAISGKAKEFAAAQTAGRLESKRVMKHAAYARLFETIFKFKLAYTDEKRPVVADAPNGDRDYSEFDRYLFLEQDAAGEWYWNDDFLFSCDVSASLASNREAMWQETRLNLQTGAFGNPQDTNTLLLFWRKMEMLHYPGASETKAFLEQIQQEQMQAQQAQMQAQMQMQQAQMQQQTQLQQSMTTEKYQRELEKEMTVESMKHRNKQELQAQKDAARFTQSANRPPPMRQV